MWWVSWIQYTNGSWLFIQFASLCLFTGSFNINIVICEFDPASLLLAGCFPISWRSFFTASSVFTIWYFFCSDCYWLFLSIFSVSFRSACKADLVLMKSHSNCLSRKDFFSLPLMKLSLAGYEVLGWKFFCLRMLNIGPHSLLACRVSAERSTVNLLGFPLWVTGPFSVGALNIFPSFLPWWIWWLCALGLLFLRNIFVVFSVLPGVECWPALLV